MQLTLKFLYLLSITFWIGSIFFFSLITAPSIFKILSRDIAGDLVSDIFPKYYLIAYICGGVALTVTIISGIIENTLSRISSALRILILMSMLGLAIYGGAVIRPQTLAARSEMRSLAQAEDPSQYKLVKTRFDNIHRQSVIMNSIVFLLGIAIVFITAYTYKE
jgi:hypothetical protein